MVPELDLGSCSHITVEAFIHFNVNEQQRVIYSFNCPILPRIVVMKSIEALRYSGLCSKVPNLKRNRCVTI